VSVPLNELNAMPVNDAADRFRSCCGSSRWVDAMVARRPFESTTAVFAAADEIWDDCTEDDWLEAFSHHPRIGAKSGVEKQNNQAKSWSRGEQESVEQAPNAIRGELEQVNREYESRFGHIYIVSAAGKSADELLAIAKRRLGNEPSAELRVAAEEQGKITRSRLGKLLGVET
jgi:2-oxo-4-hydroxy-4-carboxy-5-ureidoimidazoline decarboxylase